MPNYCDFRLRCSGPAQDIEGFAAHWDGMLRDSKSEPDQNGFTAKMCASKSEIAIPTATI